MANITLHYRCEKVEAGPDGFVVVTLAPAVMHGVLGQHFQVTITHPELQDYFKVGDVFALPIERVAMVDTAEETS